MQLLSASRPGPPAPDQGGRVGGTGADSLSHSREKRRDVEVLPGVKLATMSPSRLVRPFDFGC
ncbi:332b9b35-679b-494b-8c18-119f68d5912f [Thermothielavioides terrestris]|uniref:332b9b35-679b-494b-8c18-119f68d5912f n=1 Tax=Thermothielavioides terrestris TaxID=2587410 RepID=A0A446BW45_9PEZI|nr:332b9b35-679b-494b-8c18-119f68d5912f [Thermothielavioides terrestris]